jgi:hypothetical protein
MNAKRNSDTGATSHGILHLLSQGAVCPQSATYVSSTSVTHVIATDSFAGPGLSSVAPSALLCPETFSWPPQILCKRNKRNSAGGNLSVLGPFCTKIVARPSAVLLEASSSRGSLLFHKGASMDAALHTQLTIAAVVCSATALFFSLLAAFPGFKTVLAVVRDGVLWFCLFVVLGGVGFFTWQQMQKASSPTITVGQTSSLP